jgi:uncharacterized protein (UPF0303 family)
LAIAEDLERIARQESALQFTRFDDEVAWRLGAGLRITAVARRHVVVIDVRSMARHRTMLTGCGERRIR